MASGSSSKKTSLTPSDVYVRIRPQTSEGGHRQDGQAVAKMLHSWTDDSVTIGWTCSKHDDMGRALPASDGQRHTYPRRVFGPEETQDAVYDTVVPPMIDKLLGIAGPHAETRTAAPIHALLFAYGQTGTGKTHTTLGPDSALRQAPPDGSVDPRWGCFPRVTYDIFQRLLGLGRPFVVAMSAVEFYLAAANDLLAFNNPIAVSADNEPVGMAYRVLHAPQDVIPVLALARSNRHNRHTRMNLAKSGGDDAHGGSSRGHAMFILTVLQLDPTTAKMVRTTFNLVDLAGAERPDKTGAQRVNADQAMVEMMRAMRDPDFEMSTGCQAFAINFELSALASTAKNAAEYNKKNGGVGKLFSPSATLNTDACRIMGTCFGGLACLSVIVTLSQAPQCGWETWFSCNYGLDLSRLRAPLRGKGFVSVRSMLKDLQRTLAENRDALKQPIKNKMMKWKRLAAIGGALSQMMLIRELILKSPVPGIDPNDVGVFDMPPPATTGWVFPDRGGLQSKYELKGHWDNAAYNDWLGQFATTSTAEDLEHWMNKVSIKEQRKVMDKMVSYLRFDPINQAWLARCPPTGPIAVDTTPFPPCDNTYVPVHVHRPEAAGPGSPAIVYAHGGAAIFCDAKYIESHCARYAAENNAVVFSIDYRLAPENKAPAGIFDAVGVILYLRANAESLGIDRSRIAVMGESGGGYIAAGAAMELARRGQSDVLKLCVPLIPQVSDIVLKKPYHAVEGGETAKSWWSWVFKQLLPREGADISYVCVNRASKEVLENFPPTAIITAEFDVCRRMAEDLGEKLHNAGRLVEFVCHPGGNHGWNMMMSHPLSAMYWEDIQALLLTHLISTS